jgi:hypothetical protein
MAYFSDLTSYCYLEDMPAAKNVGWLRQGHEFDTMAPTEETLDLLWSFCSFPVLRMRGIHQCDLCAIPQAVTVVRNGATLMLGTGEIRVFSSEPDTSVLKRALGHTESGGLFFLSRSPLAWSIFAAPTLIYHYVQTHHYKPPDEFLRAMKEGPKPPDPEYFERLQKLDLERHKM